MGDAISLMKELCTGEEDKKERIPPTEWQWHGLVGHCICGHWCRFHLTTVVGRHMISTIGKYIHPRHAMGREQAEQEWLEANPDGEDIGGDRKYETAVFLVAHDEVCGCGCGGPCVKDWSELDMRGYNDSKSAREGHMDMCYKWSAQAVEGGS